MRVVFNRKLLVRMHDDLETQKQKEINDFHYSPQEACYFLAGNNETFSTSLRSAISTTDSKTCDPNIAKGGVACIDLGGLVNGTVTKPTYLYAAGALNTKTAFGETSLWNGTRPRSHKRGMRYDASISNFPQKAVVIVDMENMEKRCSVQVNGEPYTVVFAPLNATALPGIGYISTSGAKTFGMGLSLVISAVAILFV